MGVGGPSSGPCINMASVGAAGVGGATRVLSIVAALSAVASPALVRVLSAAAVLLMLVVLASNNCEVSTAAAAEVAAGAGVEASTGVGVAAVGG